MKSTLTILFSFLSLFVFGQPTGNIETDTAKANRMFEEALLVENKTDRISLLEKSLILYESHTFNEKQIEINSQLAYVYLHKNDSLLKIYANKAIDLATTYLKTDTNERLYYAHKALLCIYHISNTTIAIEHGQKALASSFKPSKKYFDIIFYLTSNYTYANDIISLKKIIEESEVIIKKDTIWNDNLPLLYRSKMQLNYMTQNYEKAILYGKQCIIENKKYPIYNNTELGPIYVEIANYYAYLGQHKKAIQSINEGLKIANPAKNSKTYASYQANLSTIYGLKKETKDKAIVTGLKAIAIFEEDKVGNSNFLQILNYNVSNYYFDLNDFTNAKKYIEQSMSFGDNPYVKVHYALVLKELEQFDKALTVIQQLLIDNFENFNDTEIYSNPSKYEVISDYRFVTNLFRDKTSILIEKGRKYGNDKDIEKGVATGDLALFHINTALEKMKGFQEARFQRSEALLKVLEYQLIGVFEQNQLNENAEHLEKLYKIIETRKSKFLLETLQHSLISDNIVQKEQELVNKKNQIEQKLYFAPKDSIDFYQTALFTANEVLETFIESVNSENAKTSYYLNHNKIINFRTIQEHLDDQTTVVEYAYAKGQKQTFVYIMTISKNGINTIKHITNDKDLMNKIEALNQLLQNPFLIQNTNREKFINLSNELYQILIEPIAKELGDKKKLIIIPEGKLFEVPFEVLLASNEKKPFHELNFLIKDFDISYQYSATIYHQLKEKAAIKNNSFLGFAPVFENGQTIDMASRAADFIVDSLYRSIDNEQFVILPNTEKEISEIEKIIQSKNGQTTTLLKSSATKSNLTNKIKSQPYQFVHIATHGIVNFQNPKLSALVCYNDENNVEKALYFANEIQMQDIQADLVVLSSCESGIGQLVAGEGLIALNRSFIYSGANNVLFSLWKVNDEQTSQLMIDFYKFYYQNPSYASALRQTKLKMLQNPITANPRFWAAFVLIGK